MKPANFPERKAARRRRANPALDIPDQIHVQTKKNRSGQGKIK